MNIKHLGTFVAAIILCQLVGFLATILAEDSLATWYVHLQKPSFTPPDWAFGFVWTILYLLMGMAFYLVLLQKKHSEATVIFIEQLFLNFAWSFIFFGLKSPFYGLMAAVLLFFAVALTIIRFYKISKDAALFLVPYFLWVSFVVVLNYHILVLN